MASGWSSYDALKALGLTTSASPDAARRAYRRLAKRLHPDKGGSKADFQALQEKYSVALAYLEKLESLGAQRPRPPVEPADAERAPRARSSQTVRSDYAVSPDRQQAATAIVCLCALIALIGSGSVGKAVVAFAMTLLVFAVPFVTYRYIVRRRRRASARGA
jgi:preprotein translocase subunit Sec63